MTYFFRILSNEEEKFLLEMELGADMNFLSFHIAIQENLNYDHTQMASFYLTDKNWEKEFEITLMEMDEGEELLSMKDCIIHDYLKSEGDRLLYVFDFFEERAYNVELVKISDTNKDKLPHLINLKGEIPEQNRPPESLTDLLDEDFDDDDDIRFESLDGLDI